MGMPGGVPKEIRSKPVMEEICAAKNTGTRNHQGLGSKDGGRKAKGDKVRKR